MRLNIINKVNLRLTRESSNNMLFMKKIKQNIFKGHLEIQKQCYGMNYMQNMRTCTIVEQFKKSYLIEYFQ